MFTIIITITIIYFLRMRGRKLLKTPVNVVGRPKLDPLQKQANNHSLIGGNIIHKISRIRTFTSESPVVLWTVTPARCIVQDAIFTLALRTAH